MKITRRREFIQNTLKALIALDISNNLLFSNKRSLTSYKLPGDKKLKLSLAQWSLHRSFNSGELHPDDFAKIARGTYNIDAIEYVNSFYTEKASDLGFWKMMKQKADDNGVNSLLIMVDEEGDFGVADKSMRIKAVDNHKKWVEAARILGCHSIRVNAFGDQDVQIFKNAMVESMPSLCEFASVHDINVIIENHGLHSSNANVIVDIVKEVGLSNFGTFPDFGNWCLSAKWGSTQIECSKSFDIYEGVKKFLPYAKAVSAKSYNFNEAGEQTTIDYYKMLEMVKLSDYNGHIGIEYEGTELNEHDGILATKKLIEKIWNGI